MKGNAIWLLVLAAAMVWHVLAQPGPAESPPAAKAKPVFETQDLFKSTRIPNIVVAADGSVLALAKSGRMLRRSEDAGKTWSKAREIGADAGGSAIVDENTGDVMIVNPGKGCLWRSGDHGKTWKRQEIEVKPNLLGHGSREK
nr:exo-alpha-sialidase [Planctomycetota bacterium]